jgi:two-component system sensor histidine kinase/response regulator
MMNMDGQYILVVEDHPSLLAAIQAILDGEGYTVVTATDGVQALQVLEEVRVNLILADIMMPRMDGYALYEAVRSRSEWTTIPFIFLTAKATKKDILKGKALGPDDYITKPFDSDELVVTVRSRLQRVQDIRAASQAEFDQLKQQIVTVLGHELRTPLSYVLGYTDLALQDVPSCSPETLQQFLSAIKNGADRLTRLVEDLLLLVEVDTGQIVHDMRVLAEVHRHVAAVVEQAVQLHEEHAMARGVTLQVQVEPDLPPVRLYEPYIVNALGRLVDNGIKFSRGEDKQVMVIARAKDGWVEFSVSDQGIGIAPEEIPHLFQRFRQIGRPKMQQQGVGLGLAIASDLVHIHGGDIIVESSLGRGSVFKIRLPVAGEPAAET